MDEILWCDHSNETFSAVLLHGIICFFNILQNEILVFFLNLVFGTLGSESVKAACRILCFNSDILVFLLFSFLKNYFRDGWNVFDFIVVLGSLLDFALTKSLVRTNSRVN